MKHALLSTLTVALFSVALFSVTLFSVTLPAVAAADAGPTGDALFTPATEARPAPEAGEEPLFLDDSTDDPVYLCFSLDPDVVCSVSFSCSSTVACADTGTGVKLRTCTCCGPCTELPCHCDTSTTPVGCC